MLKLSLLLVALAGAPVAAAPSTPPTPASPASLGLSKEGDTAVRYLIKAEVFGGWTVGAAAAPSVAVKALRTIMKEKHAIAALEHVRTHAKMAGQLMALAGLYDLDPKRFARALPAYLDVKDTVRVWETGCMMGPPRTVADVARAKGAIQTGGADKPLPAWRGSIVFDLAGGGYSAAMREQP